jgi:hypothetical protein
MAWLTGEQLWLFGADLFDGFERGLEAKGLEPLGVVVGQQPISDAAPQVVDRGVVEGANGGVFDGSDHSFSLAVGPWMIGLGEPVLDAVLGASPSEDMSDEAIPGPLVMLDELNAVTRASALGRCMLSNSNNFRHS